MEYLSIRQTAENGEYPKEEYRYCVQKIVSRVRLRWIHHGLFRVMQKSQKMRESDQENILN